jgi:hypothetical protein
LINEHKLRYLGASKVEKPKVAKDIVKAWRSLDPPGRFLARKDESKKGPGSVKGEGTVWQDVGDKKAREKASQCLRERTPDVIPYVREMQRQHDILTGQGLRMVEQQMRIRAEQGHSKADNTTFAGSAALADGANCLHSINGKHPAAVMSEFEQAFSVEHFFTHGFQNTPAYSASYQHGNDPLSLIQMSQDPQRWDQAMGFSNSMSMPPPPNVFSGVTDLEPVALSSLKEAGRLPDRVGSLSLPPLNMNATGDEITLEEYMESMKGFTAYHLEDQEKNEDITMQNESWVGSFNSVDPHSNGDSDSHLDFSKAELETPPTPSKRKMLNKAEAKGDTKPEPRASGKLDSSLRKDALAKHLGQSTRTALSGKSTGMSVVSQKSALSAMSGISMFSEMSEQTRGSKLSAARGPSSMSVMSDFTDLTDLSETLGNLDLQQAPAAASTNS